MKFDSRTVLAGAAALLLVSPFAHAHPGPGAAGGIAAGAAHPFTGIDHLLAMLAVGLCAAQVGGRAIWALPATFLAFMVGGAELGIHRTQVPMVEQGIAASLFVLGLLVATGSRTRVPIIAGLMALFALFHGHAHGYEMQSGMHAAAYTTGFVLATAFLIAAGVAIGTALRRTNRPHLAKWAGMAIAICAVVPLLS